MQDITIKALSFVKASKHRTNVLKAVVSRIITPREISKITGMYISHVSKALADLKSLELIVCLNEDDRKSRLYKATGLGKKIWSVIQKNE